MNITIETLTRTIFDAFNTRDVSKLEEYLDDDAVFDFPGKELLRGLKRMVLFFNILFRKYPRLIFTVEDSVVEGDKACAIWSNEGEDKDRNPYTNRGVTFVRARKGKIVFISDYFKDTSFVEST